VVRYLASWWAAGTRLTRCELPGSTMPLIVASDECPCEKIRPPWVFVGATSQKLGDGVQPRSEFIRGFRSPVSSVEYAFMRIQTRTVPFSLSPRSLSLPKNTIFTAAVAAVLLTSSLFPARAAENDALKSVTAGDGRERIYGLVSPLDQQRRNFYLLTSGGQVEVRMADDGRVGLLFLQGDIHKQLERREISIADTGQKVRLPEKLYVKVLFKDWHAAESALKSGTFHDGMLYAVPLPDHLPTSDELWLSGELTGLESGQIPPTKIMTAGGKRFTGSTGGHNSYEQIAGLFDVGAIRPFVNEASVYGKLVGGVFVANHVLLRPIPDQVAQDDPKLPRYLFIGDSISGNYGPALREALEGKFNVHHPPTNAARAVEAAAKCRPGSAVIGRRGGTGTSSASISATGTNESPRRITRRTWKA
jgi:hypothetical protein